MISVIKIPKAQLLEMWPHVSPFLEKGMKAAFDTSLMNIAEDVCNDMASVWAIFEENKIKAAFASSICIDEQKGGKVVVVYALGGDDVLNWAQALRDEIEQYGAFHDCESMRFYGRKAWARILPDFHIIGADQGETIYERAIQ